MAGSNCKYRISLIRPRSDYQSNYALSNQSHEQIKGSVAVRGFILQVEKTLMVHLKLKLKIPLSQLMSGNVPQLIGLFTDTL